MGFQCSFVTYFIEKVDMIHQKTEYNKRLTILIN